MLAGNDAGEQVLSVHNPDQMLHRNVWISSWVLTISLLGDALLYVILPVHAAAFGLSIGAVGFLLVLALMVKGLLAVCPAMPETLQGLFPTPRPARHR